MRRLLVGELQGFLRLGAGGNAVVESEAPACLQLLGVVLEDAVQLVAAVPSTSAEILAGLPEGCEVLGEFIREAYSDAGLVAKASSNASYRYVAGCSPDGNLVAWDIRAQNADGGFEAVEVVAAASESTLILARGRLTISLASGDSQSSSAERLEELASRVPQGLRFRLPGATTLPTLAQLRKQQPAPRLPTPAGAAKKSSAAVGSTYAIEVLSDLFGSPAPSNYLEFDAEAPVDFAFDFAAYLPSGSEAVAAVERLMAALRRQLRSLASTAKGAAPGGNGCAFRCFAPDPSGFLVLSLAGTEEVAQRRRLHQLLGLPEAPLLRPECALPLLEEALPRERGKLENPHAACGLRPSWWTESESTLTASVRGCYEYAHYMQDSFDDNGWGCAYRSLQTCVSWFRRQHYTVKEVPSIPDIQGHLKRIDEAHRDLRVGSRQWIGTTEGMYLLQDYLGVDSRFLHCQDAADMAAQMPQVLQHLRREGTPVMMGAGQKAFTLVGLCYDSETGEVAFLIVDPHYTGADDLKTILAKGWVGWKKLDFFEKEAGTGFINLCLPMVPRGPEQI
eukprot:TRINITY_DN16827_c0_g2_i2.p1 TRINITY_DN16827_c0_g2~~TRINITY_DN16827_c0_g2_i2.p1  ORF type:complete len:563 (-),score=130.69 TRINITY_DN16827_c0_g2_i2:82-1770(-)